MLVRFFHLDIDKIFLIELISLFVRSSVLTNNTSIRVNAIYAGFCEAYAGTDSSPRVVKSIAKLLRLRARDAERRDKRRFTVITLAACQREQTHAFVMHSFGFDGFDMKKYMKEQPAAIKMLIQLPFPRTIIIRECCELRGELHRVASSSIKEKS